MKTLSSWMGMPKEDFEKLTDVRSRPDEKFNYDSPTQRGGASPSAKEHITANTED